MVNPNYNSAVRNHGKPGGRPSPGTPSGAKAGIVEKPGFKGASAPGKKGPDRSKGGTKAKVYPSSDGI